MKAETILPGSARGPVIRLDGPLSFWGGVDPFTGALTDPRSPHHGVKIGGAVLMVSETRGSSSSSIRRITTAERGKRRSRFA